MSPYRLPLLCECQRKEDFVEHRDMDSSYIVRIMHCDASHVVLLHRRWLDAIVYTDGRPFGALMLDKSPDECCRMVSRTLLGALRFKPDYVVVVDDEGTGAPLYSGLTMDSALRCATLRSTVALAEGPHNLHNLLGRLLARQFQSLADKGFFEDPKNRKYSPRWSCQ